MIKRPLLTDEPKRIRLRWCLARRVWTLRTWRRIHWSDESRFLLHVTDGRMRMWRHKDTAYTPRNIKATVPYGGGFCNGVGLSIAWRQDGLGDHTGQTNRWILYSRRPRAGSFSSFETHPLATRPVYIDDNARFHHSRAVTAYFQGNAIETLPWPARSPDLNPLEHVWDILRRQTQKMDPPPQTLDELEAALHREWRPFIKLDVWPVGWDVGSRQLSVHVEGSPVIEHMWYKFYLETQSDIFIKKL